MRMRRAYAGQHRFCNASGVGNYENLVGMRFGTKISQRVINQEGVHPGTINSLFSINTHPWLIRKRKDKFLSSTFIRAIDDVRIYNRALTEEEVQQLYELGSR